MKVAIIGAGFSGMLAAYLLEKQGVQVTVYEKEEMIGGHCRTLVHKDLLIEMGSVFCFNDDIKALLIELDITFSERFSYRNFFNQHYVSAEQISRDQVSALLVELNRLKVILDNYPDAFHSAHYGTVHEELTMSLEAFLEKHELTTIAQAIAPHLSSFGFGHINDISAFYAFSVFDFDTINTFIRSEKLLFPDNGFSEVIHKLSQNVSDIRYGMAVKSIEPLTSQVRIETDYGSDCYDKVLITAQLGGGVIKDDFYNNWLLKLESNPFISCAYKVNSKNMVTTYFKSHLGQNNKVQFFHTFKQHQKTVLVAYAYGELNNELVQGITADIEKIDVQVKHLIAVKEWRIFPHVKGAGLTKDFYSKMIENQGKSGIYMGGTLVTKPSIASLYESVRVLVLEMVSF